MDNNKPDLPLRRCVWQNKKNMQKLVTIPKNNPIKNGDIVEIKKVELVDE
jgi:hypothetical protein